jgi:hypothetical protein
MTWANIRTNWKTSGAGLIAAVAGLFAILYPADAVFITQIAASVAAIAFCLFALSAKDNDVTGTAANPRAVIAGGEVAPPTPAAVAEATTRATPAPPVDPPKP